MTEMNLQDPPLPSRASGITLVLHSDVAQVRAAAPVLGMTPKAIRRKIEEGVWLEGHEYFRRDGRIWIDFVGVARWVRGERRAAA